MPRQALHIAPLVVLLFGGAARAQQFTEWSAPRNLGEMVSSSANDQHPTLSQDGLTLVFASDRPGSLGEFDLWVSERDCTDDTDPSCQWKTPANLGRPVNSESRDFAPNLATDGHWLFFHSNRPGGCGGSDLYATHRQDRRDDFGWEPPTNLGCALNTASDDAGPTFFEDETTGALYLYFTRCNALEPPLYAPCAPAPSPDQDRFDIYVSTCTADLDSCNRQQLWGAGQSVPELSSPVRDTRTAIRRRDGLEMIISTNRQGGIGSSDLWVSTRASTQDPWSLPENLGLPVNSTAFDGAPALSWDGLTLIFYSLRAGGYGNADLYMSTRTKLPD